MTFKSYDLGNRDGLEEATRTLGIYVSGAIGTAEWFAKRTHKLETIGGEHNLAIVAAHEETLRIKVAVAVALAENVWRLAKLADKAREWVG